MTSKGSVQGRTWNRPSSMTVQGYLSVCFGLLTTCTVGQCFLKVGEKSSSVKQTFGCRDGGEISAETR